MLTIEEIVAQEIFPFTGDLQVKPLEPRVIPEAAAARRRPRRMWVLRSARL